MIGLDSNVLVRYLTQDDADQAASANVAVGGLTRDDPGFLGMITLVETYWVLRNSYEFDHATVVDALRALAEADEIVVENAPVVARALVHAAAGADFADALIAETARAAGCREIVTFDKKASRRLGLRLLD